MFVEPEDLISTEYNGARNFMTPGVVSYHWLVEPGERDGIVFAAEISRGAGFSNEPIFGVSVVSGDSCGNTERHTDLSEMFFSWAKAKAHVDSLRDKLSNQEG